MSNVLNLIKSIQETAGKPPCKKTVQKIIYLMQEVNGDLWFDYSIHFYGPYSADLDSEIRYLFDCGDLNITTTAFGHMLSVNNPSEVPSVDQSVQKITNYFSLKTPSELELLATTLYVQRETQNTNLQDIIKNVVKIKGTKYPEIQIKTAIAELENYGYFKIA